ncbi:sensor histidine kinase [Jidongwangia harbinensis]|uniref:sensor histidine kinase n=1 Tax=Jidongwangia harbinensis TaxID=2878561 RepID=UPI001CDA1F56|nr:HAMP domain-containing sensor histidine kinase [Jidongwangia harbinensis]MCA2217946.1 HAMP domain-containing histidine kinase [Jidongwangia harbinensis]
MTGSALGHLRRLPRRITVWSCGAATIGLLVLGTLLIRADTAEREAELDGNLRRVTASVVRLVGYDGTVNTVDVAEDELSRGCPEFAILPGATERFTGYVSELDCAAVDRAVLAGWAADAVATGRLLNANLTGTDGRPVRIGVEPFRKSNGQFVGAVVALADAGPARAAHRRFVLLLVGGCVLLLAAVGATSHLLAARAVRPVVGVLEQQEALLADAAHDLRTPVAALRALAEAALLNPDRRTELLPRTVDLAQRMGTIIDGVLIRARLAAGVDPLAVEPVWLDQLVTTVVDETPADGAQITLATAPTKVEADPALLQRAIANLLDNAVRHGRVPGQAAVVHITVAGGRIIVADHGPGIDPELARSTFDRFSSTGGSSGLGLSIVRWVAQAHGGTLRVYNAEEGGAIFELVLPSGDA